MTTHSEDEPAGRECPGCRSTVPAGNFCTDCGTDFAASDGYWRSLLRPSSFAVSSREPLLLPLMTSSLFPHLAETSRRPFRHGLFLVLAALVSFSMLRWLAPLIIVTCLGVPLLFVLYMWQSGVFRDVSRGVLVLATVSGAGVSAVWWVWTGKLVADAYGIPLAAGSQLQEELALGLAVTVGGIALMLMPVVMVKLLRVRVRESLDGFVIGAVCAMSYSAAGTTAWIAPQFLTGLLDNYSSWRLLEEAYLYGFIDPPTAAVAGGLLGLRLWYRPGPEPAGHSRRVGMTLTVFTLVGIALYVGIYVVDAAQLPRFAEMTAITVLAGLSLLTLRLAVQVTLLHEAADPGTGRPVLCEDCERTVPDRPFCAECGAAARATSRETRSLRFQSASGPGDRRPSGRQTR